MAALKYWDPILKWLSVVADEPADSDADPEVKGIYGGCTISVTIAGADARAVRAEDLSPAAALLALATIEARLDDGDLKLNASTPLRLVANCPVIDLPDGVTLWYLFHFHHVTYNGLSQTLPDITVTAPFIAEAHSDTTDGHVVKNLATSEWLNPADAIDGAILVRSVPDDVAVVGGQIQFYAQGAPLGDPLTIPGGTGGDIIGGAP